MPADVEPQGRGPRPGGAQRLRIEVVADEREPSPRCALQDGPVDGEQQLAVAARGVQHADVGSVG